MTEVAKDFVALILACAISFFLITAFIKFMAIPHKVIKIDCTTAEWHPDVPPDHKKLCRSQTWTRKN